MNEALKDCSIKPIDSMETVSKLKKSIEKIIHPDNRNDLEKIFNYD